MNWIALIIFGTFGLIALLILVLVIVIYYKLKNRTHIRATIFLKTGGQLTSNIKRTDSFFTVNGKSYTFDEKAVLKTKLRDYIYYIENNPSPLIFNFEEFKPKIYGDDFKTVLENDLVTKLFSLKIMEMIQLLLIIVLIVCILGLGLSAWGLFSGAQLKASPENYAILINATKTAISGGVA